MSPRAFDNVLFEFTLTLRAGALDVCNPSRSMLRKVFNQHGLPLVLGPGSPWTKIGVACLEGLFEPQSRSYVRFRRLLDRLKARGDCVEHSVSCVLRPRARLGRASTGRFVSASERLRAG